MVKLGQLLAATVLIAACVKSTVGQTTLRYLPALQRTSGPLSGETLIQPNNACQPSFNETTNELDEHVKIVCNASTSVTLTTYLSSDAKCSGAIQTQSVVPLPHTVDGVQLTCVVGAISGYVVENVYSAAGGCASQPPCNVKLFAAGVCMQNANAITMGGLTFSSKHAWANGTLAKYTSTDCTGEPAFVSNIADTCTDGANNTCTNGSTALYTQNTVPFVPPAGSPNLVRKSITSGPFNGFVTIEPDSICMPSFNDTTNVLTEHVRVVCTGLAGPVVHTHAADDKDCSKPAEVAPLDLPISVGGTTIECIAGSMDGFVITTSYLTAECGSVSACDATAMGTGMCIPFTQALVFGNVSIGSNLAFTNGSIARYSSFNCSGDPVIVSDETVCPATPNGECTDGTTTSYDVAVAFARVTDAFSTAPTASPTAAPTAAPTAVPTAAPSGSPTFVPTAAPTETPSTVPTSAPVAAASASGSGSGLGDDRVVAGIGAAVGLGVVFAIVAALILRGQKSTGAGAGGAGAKMTEPLSFGTATVGNPSFAAENFEDTASATDEFELE